MNASTKLESPFDELWAVHEFFRKCGFASAQIFIVFDSEDGGGAGVLLRHGEREFVISVASHIGDRDAFLTSWDSAVEGINSRQVPKRELERVWEGSAIQRQLPGCLLAMAAKGILPVNDMN